MTAGSDSEPTHPAPCRDPSVVGDLLARDRRTDGTALRVAESGRTYSYRDLITTSYKVGNVLRYLGVRPGDEVAVVPHGRPEPVLSLFGAAQLGAVVRFSDESDSSPPRVVVAPAEQEGEFDLPPGHRLLVYGERPESPSTTHWETEVWSENPAVHPVDVDPAWSLLVDDGTEVTHRDAISAAGESATGLEPGDERSVSGSFADADTAVNGLLAPILAGAIIVI